MKKRMTVDVLAEFHGGQVRPLSLSLSDGRRISIDRIKDIRRAPSRSGGAGLRYTCVIADREVSLFFDEWENVWWYDT